jgi:hypothetical protein
MLHRNVLQGISSDSSPEENSLYCNLSLLGITGQAAKHNIEVARTSFRKPNPRGLELVLFYLYAAICGESRALKVSACCASPLSPRLCVLSVPCARP